MRAAAVYALGTFLNSSTERTDHANAIDHSIGMMLINKVANDGSPLVRMVCLETITNLIHFTFFNYALLVTKMLCLTGEIKKGSS